MEQLNKQLLDFIHHSEDSFVATVGIGIPNVKHELHLIDKSQFLEFAPSLAGDIKELSDKFSVLVKIEVGGLFDKFTVDGIFDNSQDALDVLNKNLRDAIK